MTAIDPEDKKERHVEDEEQGDSTRTRLPDRFHRLAPAARIDFQRSCASTRKMLVQWDPCDQAVNIVLTYTHGVGGSSYSDDFIEQT